MFDAEFEYSTAKLCKLNKILFESFRFMAPVVKVDELWT